MENKINVIKAKDEYAKYLGALDWYDHINGMSARDVEIEMEYVFEYLTNPMLEMLEEFIYNCCGEQECEEELIKGLGITLYNSVLKAKLLIRKATEL